MLLPRRNSGNTRNVLQWYHFEFDEWIKSGKPEQAVSELNLGDRELTVLPPEIKTLTLLTALFCSYNKLTRISLEIFQLTSLQEFHIGNNKLDYLPPEIGLLKNLKVLFLNNNEITVLPPEIGDLDSLDNLFMYNNKLVTLPPEIGNLKSLQLLGLDSNEIVSIPPEIGRLKSLKILQLGDNRLESLPPEIGDLESLTHLYLINQGITAIPPEIGKLQALCELWIYTNLLVTLPSTLCDCVNLRFIFFSDNPIEYIPPNVRRLIDRQHDAQGVYNDRQSVHNSGIQTSIKDSIMRLLSVKPTYDFEGVTALVLSDQTLTLFAKESLVEYCKDESVHTVLNLTFSDLLTAVWNRIVANENAVEIKAVLNTEMMDAECKCFTGRISRLVNCLNGFDSSVEITINDSEQIGNIVLLVKEKLKGMYNVYKHRELVRSQLEERGYTEDVITEWLAYIE